MEFSKDAYIKIEQQTSEIFQEVGWGVEVVTNYERIDQVIERAYTETVIKDTSSFIFMGFAEAISGLSSVFFGSALNNDQDYRV